MAALLIGELTSDLEGIELLEQRFRSGERRQLWAPSYLRHSLADRPLYLLTSDSTFSAGEYLPYILKALGRATVVGETTPGGAYRGQTVALNPHFAAWLSIAEPIVKATGSNWEARGVTPDIQVAAGSALERAHAEILTEEAAAMEKGPARTLVEWTAERLRAQANPQLIGAPELSEIPGRYGSRQIRVVAGGLQYQRDGGTAFEMLKLGPDRFALLGYEPIRIHFVRDASRRVIELVGERPDGSSHRDRRDGL